nr:MAG TPA: RFX DNA-binding domain protein [Caudoviricetes sp.]
MLGYSRRETRFLTLDELLAQFTEYCLMHGIKLPEERGIGDGTA